MDYKPLIGAQSGALVIGLSRVAITTVSLPLMAFIYCIVWSLLFNLSDSTSTHCGVDNYLPSVSAAIGAFAPQKYVWRTAIALHSTPRYMFAALYYLIQHKSLYLFIVNILEISALLGLTFVSSTEHFPFHAKCFVTFMTSSMIGMLGMLCISSKAQMRSSIKKYAVMANITAAAFAVYFYMRHNWFCETGVYTLFALSEYVVVFSNMLFHFQAYFDFPNIKLCIISDKHQSESDSFA